MVVGLILDIVTIVVVLVLSSFIFVRSKKQEKTIYEIKTTFNKGYNVISIVFIVLGFVFLGISIILYFSNTPEGVWACFAMGLSVSICGVIILYDNHLDYEAIKDNKVYIKRFWIKKEIDISEIKVVNLNPFQGGLYFLNKDNKKLFTIAMQTGNISEFITLFAKKSIKINNDVLFKTNNLNPIKAKVLLMEMGNEEEIEVVDLDMEKTIEESKKELTQRESYLLVGEEYKQDIPNKLKYEKRKVIILVVVGFILCLVAAYLFKNAFFLIMMPFVLYSTINMYTNTKKRLDVEATIDSYDLGMTHYYSNKKVVGHSKKQLKALRLSSGALIACGLIFMIPSFFCFFSKPIPKEQFIKVEGTLSYVKLDEKEYDYIAIGLDEKPDLEYRISSIYIDEVDKSIYDNNEQKLNVVLYIEEEKEIKSNSQFDENRTKKTNAYMISINGKDYLDYEGYQKGFNDDNNIGKFICVFGGIVTIGSIGVLIGFTNHYKKIEKEEYINVY